MNDDSKIISSQEMIQHVIDFTSINPESRELPSAWKKVVSNIGKNKNSGEEESEISLGERIAGNSHVVDLKNGVVLVEANHSGWIQYLRMYKKFIIKGLKWALPNLKIEDLAFRIAGSQAKLSDQYDNLVKKEKEKLYEKFSREEESLKNFSGANAPSNKSTNKNNSNANSKTELPPELNSIFERIKKEMLEEEKSGK
ncbi:MAG: DUF721 domain-containing protein [Treponema sp.]|nr:DUF721 domain-containing protein [Treponema sp.]